MTEAELRAQVVKLAHALGWRVFSLPAIRNLRPVKDAVGYPDLTLARKHRAIFIELKTETGELSVAQMNWMHELPEAYVIRPSDVDALAETLR